MFSASFDSLPALPVHALSPIHSPDPFPPARRDDDAELVRSASFTALPPLPSASQGIKRTFSENVLRANPQKPDKVSSSMQSANVELFRRASQKTRKRMTNSRFSISTAAGESAKGSTQASNNTDTPDQSKLVSRSVGGTIRSLARKSWMQSSRSTSPTNKDPSALKKKRSISPLKRQNTLLAKTIAIPEPVATRTSPRSSQYVGDLPPKVEDVRLSKEDLVPSRSSRALSELSTEVESETSSKRLSRRSSATSLKSRASMDRIFLTVRSKAPPLPTSASHDSRSVNSMEGGNKKDPLWAAFRAIDGEYSTFHAKTSLQKARVIRTVILPFLQKHEDHPSNHCLRAEDLDRRVVILNKWWTGLLELLNGRNNQSISGTDRPAFLDATAEIMFRAEWRTPSFSSLTSNHSGKSSGLEHAVSIDSDDSDFLLDSIHQNIRNIFIQNLLTQMAFVVDKLSMRSAPASLVSFSGKACAYAFVFCPGVADTLVRLWHIPAGILRRIFSEYGADQGRQIGIISNQLASSFPLPIRSLAFSSQGGLARHIQHKAQIPPGTSYIRWYGPWVNRWIGRDSDLFFVFTKYYHHLLSDFVPRALPPRERVCLPGFAPVHAQILMVLESTLYRQAGHFAAENYIPAGVGDNPDALAPLPMVIPNATRSIGENRLVMLLRDLVADTHPGRTNFRALIVGSFQYILKAATRKISMYNNDACYVLCDFLEELLPIVTKYQQLHNEEEDWSFWLQVWKQMMQSHTTMTQIRLIAFLYSMWTILVSNEQKKRSLVLDWLLSPACFNQFFCHWSPMVRHYFFRLLCWRVARCDRPASELDMEIFEALATRLNRCWAHHQYLTAEAEMRDLSPPSSNPCLPAPGRVLLIVRTDSQPTNVSFPPFDKFLPNNHTSPYDSHSSDLNQLPDADAPQANSKKRWNLLRSINPFNNTPGNDRPGEVTPPGSPITHPKNTKNKSAPPSRPTTPPYQALSFKFCLEHTTNRPSLPTKSPRRMPLPTLPPGSQKLLDELALLKRLSSEEKIASSEIKPVKPRQDELPHARYSGRALSEWAQIVSECRSFYIRRKQEGCPKDYLIETPTMAVETFRMFG